MDDNERRTLNQNLAPFRLLQDWNAILDGKALFAEMLTTASSARDAGEDVPKAVLARPNLAKALHEHPDLARSIGDDLPALHHLLDAIDLYSEQHAGAEETELAPHEDGRHD